VVPSSTLELFICEANSASNKLVQVSAAKKQKLSKIFMNLLKIQVTT